MKFLQRREIGKAKANIVIDSIENSPSNQYPATVLQKLKNALLSYKWGRNKIA